ncbi:MAG: hypothetical protein HOV82_25495 [Streptomyces sp.]|nr:hypothetical protein [Streptomyces sp.]NUS28064.1 hypothetical protein [Streptomyces sp.]NUS80976.1 hypothetical protein [Streptomyces sp.]
MVADQGPKDRDELRRIMSELASGQVAFVHAARHALDSSHPPLGRQLGGPPPWHEIEPCAPVPRSGE